jgi:hypothetical protein
MRLPQVICGKGNVCSATSSNDETVLTIVLSPLFKKNMNIKGEDPSEYLCRCTKAMQDAVSDFMKNHATLD